MKSWWLGGLLSLLCYLGFLLAQLPAQAVVNALPLPAPLRLEGVQGSLWRGELDRLRWGPEQLERVRWHLPVTSLLWLAPSLELEFGRRQGLNGQGVASVGLGGQLSLEGWQVSLDAEDLVPRLPLPIPLQGSGQLQLSLPEASLTAKGCEAVKGTLRWRGASLLTPAGELPLGEPVLTLSCRGGKLIGKLQQSSDSLSLSGEGEWGWDGRYQFKGKLTPGPAMPADMRSTLAMLGRPDSRGVVTLNVNGRL